MAQFSGFFNSTPQDIREYQASDFAGYFKQFLSDGIYVENNKMGLEVRVSPDGKIAISPGSAYVRGYLYKNSEDIILDAPVADRVLDRRSRVFLTLDEAERKIEVTMRQGDLASDPIAPAPVVTSNVKELVLGTILTRRQSTKSEVTDERLTDLCGMVTLLVDAPYEDMFAQWEVWKNDTGQVFQDWFDNIRLILDESAVGNLSNLIEDNETAILANFNELALQLARITALESAVNANTTSISLQDGALAAHENSIAGLQTDKMDKTKITISTLEPNIEAMAEGSLWFKYE